MNVSTWIRRVAVTWSLALCTVVALPACDSQSEDEDAESEDEEEEKAKKKKKKKKKRKKKKKDKPKPIEVTGYPDLVVPAGGEHFKKGMGEKKIDAYVYKPLDKYPFKQLKADFASNLKDKGWTVDGNGFYTVKKGDVSIDVIIMENKKGDACVLNVMGPT